MFHDEVILTSHGVGSRLHPRGGERSRGVSTYPSKRYDQPKSTRESETLINIPILGFTVAETDGHEVGIGRREPCRVPANYTARSLRDKACDRKTFPE